METSNHSKACVSVARRAGACPCRSAAVAGHEVTRIGSLGCMHSFMWAEMYPDVMDGVVGLSCQPVEISGRNRISRRAAAEAIRHDPDCSRIFKVRVS
jgi:hypothetical protein